MRQSGLFGLSDHIKRLSADGDPLEVLGQVIDFEASWFPSVTGAALRTSTPRQNTSILLTYPDAQA